MLLSLRDPKDSLHSFYQIRREAVESEIAELETLEKDYYDRCRGGLRSAFPDFPFALMPLSIPLFCCREEETKAVAFHELWSRFVPREHHFS